MYLAGGLAVNYWCRTRYSEDVDAAFSRKLLLDAGDITAKYRRADGQQALLYLDPNFSTSLTLMHEDYDKNAVPWENIGNERRRVHLHVLSPIDLAISKTSRLNDQDRQDVIALAQEGLLDAETYREKAEEALAYYVGDVRFVQANIATLAREIAEARPGSKPRSSRPG